MSPPTRKRVLALALAVSAGTGIGVGAAALASDSGTTTTSAAPAGEPAPTPAPAPLTLDQAKALAVQAAPGRVVEWDEDDGATGAGYDVTVLHDDGSTTEVAVDAVTGQVTSTDHDDDRD